jgi:hypothetical protein
MSVIPRPEHTDAQSTQVQLTLTWPEAEHLRITLPWVLRALADRPTLSPRQLERRRKAHSALDHLLSQLQQAEEDRDDRSAGDLSV